MKKPLSRFWPIIFIIGIWFIFSSPYFLRGKVPYASTYQVNFFPPWSHYQEFWGPVKNNAMPDVHTQIYPWKKFTIDTYKTGQLPLWNPYNFSGNPHLANFQSAVLSPFNLLFFVVPFVDAWSILILLQPLLAGLFTYFFVREIGVSRVGSLISGVAFMFSGFIVVWMAYGTLSMSITFLPLVLFGIERSFKKISLFSLSLISLGLAFSFFSGHFQTSLYLLAFSLIFFIFKSISQSSKKVFLLVLSAISLGILLSLLQIIPSIEFYLNSVRSEIFIKEGGIPFYYLVNIFSPDFFGNPVTRNDWFGYYAEWSSFIGIIPLILAFFAVFRQKSIVFFFLIMGIITLLLSLDSPLQTLVGSLKIPVLSTSNPSRIIVLFSFSFAVLSGFGLDYLKELLNKRKSKKIITPFIAVGIIMALIWILLLLGEIMPSDKIMIAKRNLVLPTFLFGGSALMVFIPRFRKELILFSMLYLLVSTSFDSLRFAQKWMPFDPKSLVYPDVAVISAMKKNIGDGRIFGNLGAEVITYYKLPFIDGYDPLYIARYGEFIRGAGNGDLLKGERSVVRLDRRGKYTDRVLDLLGVSLVFQPIADTKAGWAYPVWEKKDRYDLVYQDEKFQLFKNKKAMPRALLFNDWEVIKNDEEIIKRFYSDDFDFRKKLILEEKLDINLKQGTGSAKIATYTPNKVVIKTATSEPALLFLSDNYYSGWKAKINNTEIKIYRADYSFRAVVVPAGEREVEFTYEGWHL